jgi:hypothetical protein
MNYTLIPGQSHPASEEETMSMIRSVLTEDDAPQLQVQHSKAAPQSGAAQPVRTQQRAFVERTADPAPRRRATDLPELEAAQMSARTPGFLSRATGGLTGKAASLVARVRNFQPTTRHIALASTALLIVLRPHWFVIASVFMLLLTIGAFLVFGADRIWRNVLAWLDRVEARDAARAAQLRTRLDRFACRWDSVLDLCPDGMVDSLYMPDFQAMQQAEIDHQAVVADRLTRMVQES